MTTTEAIVLREHGGPEKLNLETVELPPIGENDIQIRHTAISVNFHDCYVRTGLYKTLNLPGIPGVDAVGAVEKIGIGVRDFAVGDRVGWITPTYGGYAARRILNANLAIRLPDFLTDNQAAASLMKALTVNMLVMRSHVVRSGQTVLVHAAAGGVGQMLCQVCHHLGARVIATVGGREKEAIARTAGAEEVLFYRETNFLDGVLGLTEGRGVDVVYDSIGADTFTRSLQCLDFGGSLVNYGQSSGAVPPFTVNDLAAKSTLVTRPVIFHFIRERSELLRMASTVFDGFRSGGLVPIEPTVLPLSAAAEAHRMIEARTSPGGIVMVPE